MMRCLMMLVAILLFCAWLAPTKTKLHGLALQALDSSLMCGLGSDDLDAERKDDEEKAAAPPPSAATQGQLKDLRRIHDEASARHAIPGEICGGFARLALWLWMSRSERPAGSEVPIGRKFRNRPSSSNTLGWQARTIQLGGCSPPASYRDISQGEQHVRSTWSLKPRANAVCG